MPWSEEPTIIKKADHHLEVCQAAAPQHRHLRICRAEDLAGMFMRGEDFVVCDAGSGEDITWSILMLITPTTTEH